jgi:CheY-like chemotaxis protein
VARIVLVADDSPTIQKRALGILKGEGFEVETVSNGVAAIKRLAVLQPVVILADVSMPGRDGYEVCQFVKKSPELSHVPVLLVVSDMEPYDNARGAEVGADGIIKKPFEAHELISIVTKFAEQMEAQTPMTAAPLAPPAPAPEFELSDERSHLDETPTLEQRAVPDFSQISEGVALAGHPVEETLEFPPGSQVGEMELSSPAPQTEVELSLEPAPLQEIADTIPAAEPENTSVGETPLAVEQPPAPTPFAPPPSPVPAETPSYIEGLEAATPEPVFIEELPAETAAPSHADDAFRTMIFRAPVEIAEPVWKDETVPAPPAPEPAGPTAVQPQFEAEAPFASLEIPGEQNPQPPFIAPPVTATSLDSFSLDDATTGQVHFVSEAAEVAPVEVALSPPGEEAPATEIAAPGPAPETAYTEFAPPGPAPEVPDTEIAPAEPAPEAPDTEMASAEPAAGAAFTEMAPAEPAPEAAYAEMAPPGPPSEAAYTEFVPPGAVPEPPDTEIAAPEPAAEAAPPEPLAEAAALPPAYDWGLIYSVVHRVVVRMSPPPLPVEVVEEIARRLAEEIATEISNESSQPQG